MSLGKIEMAPGQPAVSAEHPGRRMRQTVPAQAGTGANSWHCSPERWPETIRLSTQQDTYWSFLTAENKLIQTKIELNSEIAGLFTTVKPTGTWGKNCVSLIPVCYYLAPRGY